MHATNTKNRRRFATVLGAAALAAVTLGCATPAMALQDQAQQPAPVAAAQAPSQLGSPPAPNPSVLLNGMNMKITNNMDNWIRVYEVRLDAKDIEHRLNPGDSVTLSTNPDGGEGSHHKQTAAWIHTPRGNFLLKTVNTPWGQKMVVESKGGGIPGYGYMDAYLNPGQSKSQKARDITYVMKRTADTYPDKRLSIIGSQNWEFQLNGLEHYKK